jgi:hypothetical protein
MELGEKWPVNLPCNSDFYVNCRVLLHAANLQHGSDGFTSPPKEVMLWIFRLKNPKASAEFELEASVLATRPPKPPMLLKTQGSNR